MAVSSIKATGGDYTDIDGWEDAKDGDLVTETRQETGELYSETYSGTGNKTVFDGSTTNTTYYMKLSVNSAHRHSGTESGAGSTHAVIDGSGSVGHLFTVSDDNCVFEYLDIDGCGNGSSDEAFRVNNTGTIIRNCIIRDLTDNSDQDGVYVAASTATTVESCIFYNITRQAIINQNAASATINVRNCIAVNVVTTAASSYCGIGWDTSYNPSGSVMLVVNCYVDCAQSRKAYAKLSNPTWDAGSDYNASYDTTAQTEFGTSTNINSLAADTTQFANVTAGSEDFHLAGTGSGLYNLGTDVGSAMFVDEDIDGVAHVEWSIGADDIDTAGGVVAPTGNIYGPLYGPLGGVI